MKKLLPVLVLVLSLWGASSVSAAPYVPAGSFATDAVGSPQRAAVERSTGRLFVAGDHSVVVFAPTASGGTILTEVGWYEVSNPVGVAIDQVDGSVYVADVGNSRIARYTTDGAATPSYSFDAGFTSPAQGPGAGEVGSFAASITVDPVTRDLLVADPGSNLVKRFDRTGALQSSFDGSGSTAGVFTGLLDIAVDSTGDVLVVDSTGDIVAGGATSRVERFSSAGVSEGAIGALSAPSGVTVIPGTDQVAVASNQDTMSTFMPLTVTVFAPDGSIHSTFDLPGETFLGRVKGLAAAGDDLHRLYVVSDRDLSGFSGVNAIHRFVEDHQPAATVEAVSAIAARSVTVSGTVNPNGASATYQVEYRQANTTAWLKAPTDPVDAGAGTSDVPFSVDLSSLRPNSDFQWRVVAANDVQSTIVDGADFHTGVSAPRADTRSATSATTTSVRLNGLVDPFGQRTTYHFEYGPTTNYGSSVPTGDGAVAGSATKPLPVFGDIKDLVPGQVLHYRVIATNATGTTVGEDRAVEVPGAARVYERVTPAEKGGSDPLGTASVKAAATGGQLAYLAATTHGDGAASVTGANLYLSSRGPVSWETKGLNLPISNLRSTLAGPFRDVSADMTHGYGISTKALAPGATEGAVNYYITDARTGEARFVAGSTDRNAYQDYIIAYSGLRAATAGFEHVLIQSRAQLVPGLDPADLDNPYVSYVYDLTAGGAKLASLGSDGQRLSGELLVGSRRARHAMSSDGRRIFLSNTAQDGELGVWMREDGERSTLISASRRTGEADRMYGNALLDASADGNVVFFTTDGPLLDDSEDPGRVNTPRVYRYQVDSDELQEIYVGPVESGVSLGGVSDDGRRLFFTLSRPSGSSLFLWQQGQDVKRIVSDSDTSDTTVNATASTAAIQTTTDVTPDDHCTYEPGDERCLDVYVYDVQRDELTCATCDPANAVTGRTLIGGAGSNYLAIRYLFPGDAIGGHLPRAVDAQGGVYIDTQKRLTSEDNDGAFDVYYSRNGAIELLTPGTSSDSVFGDASTDGEDVYFSTRDRLVGTDVDDNRDYYTARLGGGLASQHASAVAPPCAGDACQGTSTPPSLATPAASIDFSGTGDQSPADAPSATVKPKLSAVKVIRGTKATLKVRVAERGRIRVTGSGLRTVTRSVAKAGSYSITVRLTTRAAETLAKKGSGKMTARVSFSPPGKAPAATSVMLRFKAATAGRHRTGSSSAARNGR
jgi:hypothetical protein